MKILWNLVYYIILWICPLLLVTTYLNDLSSHHRIHFFISLFLPFSLSFFFSSKSITSSFCPDCAHIIHMLKVLTRSILQAPCSTFCLWWNVDLGGFEAWEGRVFCFEKGKVISFVNHYHCSSNWNWRGRINSKNQSKYLFFCMHLFFNVYQVIIVTMFFQLVQ